MQSQIQSAVKWSLQWQRWARFCLEPWWLLGVNTVRALQAQEGPHQTNLCMFVLFSAVDFPPQVWVHSKNVSFCARKLTGCGMETGVNRNYVWKPYSLMQHLRWFQRRHCRGDILSSGFFQSWFFCPPLSHPPIPGIRTLPTVSR